MGLNSSENVIFVCQRTNKSVGYLIKWTLWIHNCRKDLLVQNLRDIVTNLLLERGPNVLIPYQTTTF